DPAAEDGDRHAAGFERSPVRLAVDPARETADHDEARRGQLATERARDLRPVARARASADDRHGRPFEQLNRAGAAEEETRRRIEDRRERPREAAGGAAEPAESALLEVGAIRSLVERAREALVASIARLVDDVRRRLRGEGGQRELVHRRSSSFG